jgi:hypothetical protein
MVSYDNIGTRSTLNPALIDRGVEQLRKEIVTLESWLQELAHSPAHDLESNNLGIVYLDMLQSRQEMLGELLQLKSA